MRPVVVLDACVLFKGLLTDVLLWIAFQGAFEPVWSEEIHDEWCRNLIHRLPAEAIARRRAQMDKAFPAASIMPRERLVSAIQCACRTSGQRRDAHVVATAIRAGASVIVTNNIKDFDPSVLSGYGLIRRRPDPFLVDLLGRRRVQVVAGVQAHRASLKRSAPSADQYLGQLSGPRAELMRFAASLRSSMGQF